MSNSQARLFASAIALLAGGVIANTNNIDVNFGIAIIVISSFILPGIWQVHVRVVITLFSFNLAKGGTI